MSETVPHQPVMVEVTFPFHLGGNMTEGYRCFDQNMAQDSIDVAVHSATLLERERIIKLLEADCRDGLGDNIQGCSHEVAIALIKGENK